MERQDAVALIMFLNKAVGIIPTTGAEWDGVRRCLEAIQPVANGQATLELKPNGQPQENR